MDLTNDELANRFYAQRAKLWIAGLRASIDDLMEKVGEERGE